MRQRLNAGNIWSKPSFIILRQSGLESEDKTKLRPIKKPGCTTLNTLKNKIINISVNPIKNIVIKNIYCIPEDIEFAIDCAC